MSGQAKILPVVLAGGEGTRLWPVSSASTPKQFQNLVAGQSTYQLTLLRVRDKSRFLAPVVLTGKRCALIARQQAAELGIAATIITEPVRRDSAAAIAVAALMARQHNEGRLVLALAADQLIGDVNGFLAAMELGVGAARDGSIVLFGVVPDGPLTNFGYIRPGPALADNDDLCQALEFVEKPDAARAAAFIAAGYLWNSGNFLFAPEAMLSELAKQTPEILRAAQQAMAGSRLVDGALELEAEAYGKAPAISIDFAVIERAQNISLVRGHFGWSDIGDWKALAGTVQGDGERNAVVGQGHFVQSRDCLIHSRDVLTVAIGVEGLAIVATSQGVLVVAKERAHEVKAIAAQLLALAEAR